MTRRTALALSLLAAACTTAAPAARPAAAVAPLPAGAVRHLVVFKYKPEATPAQIAELERAFEGLRERIPGILAFEKGVNHSPEGMSQGFTHVYLVTFESAAARDAYLPHPAHREFGALVGRLGVWAGGFVVDWTPAR